jgi:hypothetical protein
MLNAVKHLYRFVERLSGEAIEMLHCVQHDERYKRQDNANSTKTYAAQPSIRQR